VSRLNAPSGEFRYSLQYGFEAARSGSGFRFS
jgi:hypothetical protein